MPYALLKLENVCFARGVSLQLENICLQLAASQILLIQGDNGAGKTTLLKLIAGLLLPSSGTLIWQGKALEDDYCEYARERLFLGHKASINQQLTVEENLRYLMMLTKTQATDEQFNVTLEKISLQHYRHTPADQLSSGQRRRILLGLLCLSKTRLWLLDEPLTALDHAGQQLIQKCLQLHTERGGSVIMTSHQSLQLDNLTVNTLSL